MGDYVDLDLRNICGNVNYGQEHESARLPQVQVKYPPSLCSHFCIYQPSAWNTFECTPIYLVPSSISHRYNSQ